MAWIGAAAAIGGSLISSQGGSEGKSTEFKTWDTVPKPVQDAILETYLPAALESFDKERVPTPMGRTSLAESPLAMRGSQRLQRYSDSLGEGGLFGDRPEEAPVEAPPPNISSDELAGMRFAMDRSRRTAAGNPLGLGDSGNYTMLNPQSSEDYALLGRMSNLSPLDMALANQDVNKFAELTNGLDLNNIGQIPFRKDVLQSIMNQTGYA